jgi:hypothetical protein
LKAGQAKKQLNRDLLTSLEKIKIETKIEKNAVSNVLILKPLTLNLLKIKRHCSVLKRQSKLSATPLKVSDLILVNASVQIVKNIKMPKRWLPDYCGA